VRGLAILATSLVTISCSTDNQAPSIPKRILESLSLQECRISSFELSNSKSLDDIGLDKTLYGFRIKSDENCWNDWRTKLASIDNVTCFINLDEHGPPVDTCMRKDFFDTEDGSFMLSTRDERHFDLLWIDASPHLMSQQND
jgi:hypothetical protein